MASRKINKIVIHCSDSDIKTHDNIEIIRAWHTRPSMPANIKNAIDRGELPKSEANKYGNGWSDIGYHYFINKAGEAFKGRDESVIGAHVAGHNRDSIGICLSGRKGLPTAEQDKTLSDLCRELCQRYELSKMDIIGHRDLFSGKTCPNFDVHAIVSRWEWN